MSSFKMDEPIIKNWNTTSPSTASLMSALSNYTHYKLTTILSFIPIHVFEFYKNRII